MITAWTAVGGAASNSPIEITADAAEHNEADRTVTYIGNVVITQDGVTMQCQRVTLKQSDDGPQTITAEGRPVSIHQSPGEGRDELDAVANRAEYDLEKKLIVLSGDAELTQKGDRFKSDRIVYDLNTSVVKAGAAAEGTERVHTVIKPR